MNEKVYNLNLSKMKSVIVGYFASFICLFLLDFMIFEPVSNGTLGVTFIVILILSTVIGALIFFFHKDHSLKICANGIDEIKGDKIKHYDFADFEGTNVVKHYMNGIQSYTSRYLKFHDNTKNKTVSVNCTSLKADQFDELVAYMGKNEFEQMEKTEATDTYFDTEKYFDINKDEIAGKYKSKMNLIVIVTAIVAVLIIVFFIAVIIEVSPAIAISISVITALLAGLTIALILRALSKTISCVPSRITIDNYNLGIDGKTIDKDKTTKIVMTPPNYDTKDRELKIYMMDGTVHKFKFGRLNKSNPASGTYEDYSSLFSNIKLWSLQRNISFMASLD